ncbi:uncharacterized protein LOC143256375 isoform X2 [Tachypleus tridentatus]|uniref:uncharacterized protein LOC143256375 isoform X2 n=1 Tax=Tachypleus tridentatus TaxID=6853 RepID=UPI003FD29060
MEELTEEDKGARDEKDTTVMEELTEDKRARDDKDTIVMEELTKEDKGARDDKDTIVMEELTKEDKGARDDKDTIVMEELTEEDKGARDDKDTIVMEELTEEDKGARDDKDAIVMEELTEEDKGARDDKDTIVMEELTEEDKGARDDKDTIVMEELTEEDKGARDDKDAIVMEELTEEDKGARDDKDTIVMEELTEEDKGARDDKDTIVMEELTEEDKLTEEEAINWKYIMLHENLVEKELSEELKHIQHDQWIRRTYFLPKSSKPGVPPRSKRPKASRYGQSSVEVKGKIQPNRTTRSTSPVDKVARPISPELKTRKPVSFISNMERSMSHFSKPERSTSPLFNTERTPSPISTKDSEDPGSLILSDVKPVRPLRRFSPQVNLDEYITAQAEVSTPSGAINHLSEATSYDEPINSENRNLVENCKESLPSIDSSPKLAHKEVLEEKQKSVSFEEEVKWKTYETTNEKEQPHTVIWPFSFKSPYLEKFQKFSTSLLKPSAFSHSSSKKKTPPQRPPPPKIKQKDAAVQYEENESQQSQDGSLTMKPKVDVKLLSVESENIQRNVKIEDEVTSYPDVESFPIDEGKEVLSHDFGRNETSNSSTEERKEVDMEEKEDKEIGDILSYTVSKEIDLKTSSENKNKVENALTTSMSVSKCSKPQRPPPPDYSYIKNKISPSSQISRSISPKSMEQNLFQETKSFSSTVFKTGRQPKPPPRTKRQRSKTVEISKEVWKRDEAKVTRSKSFDKHDIKKHSGSEEKTSVNDFKSLYTQVQKGSSSVKFYSNVEAGKKPDEYPKIKFGVLRPPPPPPRYQPKLPLSQDENGQNIDPTQTGDKYSSGLKEVGVREHAGIAASGELPITQYASEENQEEEKTKLSESNLISAEQSEELLTERNMCELHLEKLKLTDSSCDTRKNMNSKNCQQFEETGDNIQVRAGKESITGDDKIQIPAGKESIHRKKSKLQSPNAERTGSHLVEEDSEKKLCDESCFPECAKGDENIFCEDSGDGVNNTSCISDIKCTSSFAHKQHSASQLFPAVSETKGQDAKTDDLLYPYPDCKEKSINKRKVEQKDLSDSNKLDEDFKKKLKLILEEHAQKVQKGVGKYKNVCGERRKDKFTYQQDNKPTIKNTPELPSCDVEMREAKQKSSGLKSSIWQEDDSSEESGNEILSLSPSIDTEEKKKSKVFCIAQKIMVSEEAFVDNLRLLNEVFRRVVEEAGKERGMSLIPEVSLNEILKYFPQLQNLNEKLLRELEERIEHWPENGRICDIFVTLGPFLKLFTSYFRDLDYTTTLIDVCRIKYPVFDYVVKEFEMSPCCQNLSLYNYMLKPVQRISQYCLLLQEYLNHLQDNSSDYEDTVAALQIMSQVASETIKHEDNISKLISIQNSLCGHHEVIRPGRMFIKEGDLMKLSRKIMKLRRFILFNDSLWYMKQVQYNLYRVKQEFPLVGMKVSIPIQQDYENEFNIISMTKSFILCASSPEERSEWINVLNKAIEENACKHSPIINAKKYGDVIVDLGSKAPELIPDSVVTSCQLCTNEFSVTFHRHHCQACGKVVCSACSANGAPLSYLGLKTARVCDECFPKLQKEDSQSKCRYSSKGGDSGSRELESDLPLTSEISDELEQSGCITKKNVLSCLQEICDSDQVTSISGHLWKRGRRGWKQYWFVIDDKVLYMYKTNEATDGVDKNLLFQLTHTVLPPVLFHADKPSCAKRWIRAMTEATHLE